MKRNGTDQTKRNLYEDGVIPIDWEKWMKIHHIKLKPTEAKNIEKKTEDA